MLKGKKIVIGITGSIAAYKIPLLIRLLVRYEAEVQVIMTPAAIDFVTPLTLSTLSRRPVLIRPFDPVSGSWNSHVDLGQWADMMLFAPVTANTLAKMAHGLADNFLVTAYLSAKCPVLIAPAMDLDMFAHPSTQTNLKILQSYGNIIIEPQTGELASGLTGQGRLEEPEKLFDIISGFFSATSDLSKKKVLITAGPTYENIDPVRFIGNDSTGTMGFALAAEAARRGAAVTLVTGPTRLTMEHPGVERIDVRSAAQMYEQCAALISGQDILIMTAAVADYSVANPSAHKIKKSGDPVSLELIPTVDILKSLSVNKKNGQFFIGFAIETEAELANATKKLREKNLDLIVLNSLNEPGAGFGTETNKVTVIGPNGVVSQGALKSKSEVAADIIDLIVKLLSKSD